MTNAELPAHQPVERRRIGGYVETVAPTTPDLDSDALPFHPLSEIPVQSRPSGSGRRRSRRPWYKRPVRVAVLSLLTILVLLTGFIGYQVQSLMNSVHSVSTPPPVVTDNTYYEADDPEAPAAPITVDTKAAQAYIEAEQESGALPETSGGFLGTIKNVAGNSGEIVQGGAAAMGVSGNSGKSMTLLLMGVDARPGSPIDIGVRPDVITVLRLDPVTQSCRALSVPRDTRVELPGYGETKINHALMVGGIPYQLRITEEFLDIEIDHYLLVDFVAFQQIVDTLGGVTVDIPEPLSKNDKVVFEQGKQTLDGTQALAYARYRTPGTDGDYGRVERQWDLLDGISESLKGQDMVGLVNDMLPTVQDHLRTDLEAADITNLAKTYGNKCTSATAADIKLMRGTRIELPDPMLNEIVYYNVVSPSTVEEFIADLYGQIDATPEGTPESTPAATPEASPTSSPELGTIDSPTVAFTLYLPRGHPQLGIVNAVLFRYDQQGSIG